MRHAIGPCSGTSSARKAYLLEIAGPTHLPSLEGDSSSPRAGVMLTASQSGAPGATGTATRIRRTSSASATRPDVSPPQSTIRRTPDSPMTCLANAPSCSPIPTASASFGPGVRRSGWLPGEVQQTSFGAYLVGVGVMQGIEDPQGVSPG